MFVKPESTNSLGKCISFAFFREDKRYYQMRTFFRVLDTIADGRIRPANKSCCLNFSAPSVQIVDALGEPLRDKYYEADSTIELLCVVRHIAMQVQYSVVQWLHGNRVLNYDTTRGGIR